MRRERYEAILKDIASKQLEKRLAMNALSQEETIVRGKSSEAAMLVSELHDKEVLLNSSIDELEKELCDIQKTFNKSIGEDLEILSRAERSFDLYISYIDEMNKRISAEDNTLAEIKEAENIAHQRIVKEEKVLSEKVRDYNIYKERLEKKYKELFPNTKLIL